MVDRIAVYAAANEIRSEGGLVSQPTVRACLKEKTGRGGSLRDIGPHLLEWKAEKAYAPVLECGGVLATISLHMAKATSALWSAAQDEVDRAFEGDRERLEATLRDEHALRTDRFADRMSLPTGKA